LHRIAAQQIPVPAKPSAFYQAQLWCAALFLARLLPKSFAHWLGRTITLIYAMLRPSRRSVVEQNLLPLCDGRIKAARRIARRLFANFGGKLVQLWRREAGMIAEQDLTQWSGWDTLAAAQATGRGVLLVTPHLGDWELGGYMLARRGIRLLVLTQAEPGAGLTELRQRARAQSGIETLVVGHDAFAFVDVIKHLQSGAVVALLVDRPAGLGLCGIAGVCGSGWAGRRSARFAGDRLRPPAAWQPRGAAADDPADHAHV
jgi:lauroyl/myristoyl acyltransferase